MSEFYFYYNRSDEIQVNKRLDLIDVDTSCYIIDATSLYKPTLKLSKSIAPNSFNYVYIPEFNRYYFVDEPPEYDSGYYTIKLRCDVLMSFKNTFTEEEVVVDRSESAYNLYLPDNELKLYGYQYYQTRKLLPETDLKFAMETEQFVLNCAGGV